MASDFSNLLTSLANSGIQTSNNALYQTIKSLIDQLQLFQDNLNGSIKTINNALNSIGIINMIEVDTSGGPVTLSLDDIVQDFVEVKDISGNAAANNITLTGVVIDDTTDPVINTDYGSYKVFRSKTDGGFYTW